MGAEKKLIRKNFRDACFQRDKYTCVMCSFQSSPDNAEKELDAHHISDRRTMPNQGYVKENGVSLCADCHIKAEEFHSTGIAHPGYAPEDLYQAIGSTYEKAVEASKKLKE